MVTDIQAIIRYTDQLNQVSQVSQNGVCLVQLQSPGQLHSFKFPLFLKSFINFCLRSSSYKCALKVCRNLLISSVHWLEFMRQVSIDPAIPPLSSQYCPGECRDGQQDCSRRKQAHLQVVAGGQVEREGGEGYITSTHNGWKTQLWWCRPPLNMISRTQWSLRPSQTIYLFIITNV